MHGSLPRCVDPWRVGALASRFEGELDAARVPRLSAIARPCRPLDVRLEFTRPEVSLQEVVRVAMQVSGCYEVICQRCLGPMELELDVESEVLLAAGEDIARRLEPTAEVQVSPPGVVLELAALVEDEVMLALPFAPRHETGRCAVHIAAAAMRDEGPDELEGGAPDARENPFAVLAALKRPQRDD